MVFNWFRRQFSVNESSPTQETPPQDPPQVEETPTDLAQPEVKSGGAEPTIEPSQQVAADYLTWAKTAYKNIQQQQKSEDPEAASPDSGDATDAATVHSPELLETADTATESEPIDDAQTSTEVESPTKAVEVAQTEGSVTDEADTAQTTAPETVETAETNADIAGDAEVLDAQTVTEVESTSTQPTAAETIETATEPELADAQTATEVEAAAATSPEPETSPVAAEAATPENAAPLPFWARESGTARLERLKETALEEPEPAAANMQAAEPALLEIPNLPFDEGFLWSAQVLAAQGRRADDVSLEEISWLKRLRQGLDKTRRSLVNQLKAIVGQGPLNQDAVMEIEALLLQADVGVEATDYIINTLQKRLLEEVLPPEQAIAYLKQILRDLLDSPIRDNYNPTFVPEKDTLNIWLMTGVNGAGKTTTIGKLAHLSQKSGYSCLIGAADTFRAAAVEQVKIWGSRSGTEVIANTGKNTDPAAVVFDAIAAAQARRTELLLIDTAGRLQNKKNLMDELSKIRRIVDKKAPDAKVEALLVLDATLGQNGLRQAQVFSEAAKLSGVVLTKLDGTAKGGVALAVVQQLGLPIRFIGAGEGIEDLRPFSSYEFVEALLNG